MPRTCAVEPLQSLIITSEQKRAGFPRIMLANILTTAAWIQTNCPNTKLTWERRIYNHVISILLTKPRMNLCFINVKVWWQIIQNHPHYCHQPGRSVEDGWEDAPISFHSVWRHLAGVSNQVSGEARVIPLAPPLPTWTHQLSSGILCQWKMKKNIGKLTIRARFRAVFERI